MINLLHKCKEEKRLTDYAYQKIVDEIWNFRSTTATMTMYDWISIPLAYNQVVTVATYGSLKFIVLGKCSYYFLFRIFCPVADWSAEFAIWEPPCGTYRMVFSCFYHFGIHILRGLAKSRWRAQVEISEKCPLPLRIIIYVHGLWFRVPYGEDDEDIDMTYILDRNLHVSFMLVDELYSHSFEPEKVTLHQCFASALSYHGALRTPFGIKATQNFLTQKDQ